MAVTPESPAFPEVQPNIGDDATLHADRDAAAYQRGTMAIQEQASTYTLFMNLSKWGSLAIAAVLLFLVIWFMPNGSFFGGAAAAFVLAVGGWWFLRSKPAH